MGQALYRTYRSRSLDEIVGQKPVITALKNALSTGKISHAYLFTGPRGVGKTSVARILAFAINNVPYSDELPVDIIEIDAASNRRIDDIRELRSKVHIAPSQAKFKVYIIDEVHMLTGESFNALLKTLEEPPSHVVFILATTEAHKLPETIISRTQRYSFKLATVAEVAAHLKHISKQEKISIDDASLELIAEHSGGSLRDALSLLDQVRHAADSVTLEITRKVMGLSETARIEELLDTLSTDNVMHTVELISAMRTEGLSANTLASQILHALRMRLQDVDKTRLQSHLQLMKDVLTVGSSSDPYIALEVALLTHQSGIHASHAVHREAAALSPALTFQPNRSEKQISKKAKKVPETTEPETKTVQSAEGSPPQNRLSIESWPLVLEQLRTSSNTIYSIIRMAEPGFDYVNEKKIVLTFGFPFHVKRLSESRNKQIFLQALEQAGYHDFDLECVLSRSEPSESTYSVTLEERPSTKHAEQNNILDNIRNVFGDAEVLE